MKYVALMLLLIGVLVCVFWARYRIVKMEVVEWESAQIDVVGKWDLDAIAELNNMKTPLPNCYVIDGDYLRLQNSGCITLTDGNIVKWKCHSLHNDMDDYESKKFCIFPAVYIFGSRKIPKIGDRHMFVSGNGKTWVGAQHFCAFLMVPIVGLKSLEDFLHSTQVQ